MSVRDADEAVIACQAGANIIDVKEPNRGSLGRADWSSIANVMRRVREIDSSVPVSVALGELSEVDAADCMNLHGRLADVSYAKLGLANAPADWRTRWDRVMSALPSEVGRVAVAYADWEQANSPDPLDVVRFASKRRCKIVLVDTFSKVGGSLFKRLSKDQVKQLIRAVHDHGMRSAMAGSLDSDAIETLLPMNPDIIAVRGAVCDGERIGTIVAEKVRGISRLVSVGPIAATDI